MSKPGQKVKWLKDGKEVKPARKKGITTKTDGRRHSLTIPRPVSDDSAEYTAKCGEEETKAKLTVEGIDHISLCCFFFLAAMIIAVGGGVTNLMFVVVCRVQTHIY